MITWFHFVRLHEPASREAHAEALRAALGPDARVGVPADAHAEAAWCLSVRRWGDDAVALEAGRGRVLEVLGDAVAVHKAWAFVEGT